jgi:hypothetical protein
MRVGDLLKELRYNKLRDRSNQVAGTASDQLWDDCTLVQYIDQAQRRFCRETELMRDFTTPEATSIQTVVGQCMYALHPSVIGVMSVRNPGDNTDLARTGHSALKTYFTPDRYFFDPSYLSELAPGKPLAWATDEGLIADAKGQGGVMALRVYPETGAGFASVLRLRVIREPLRRLSIDDLDAYLEIPETYQIDILDWAAYLALSGPDLDVAGNVDQIVRARSLKADFDDTCQRVVKQLKRKVFAPAQFGFGRNGWSYSSDWNV